MSERPATEERAGTWWFKGTWSTPIPNELVFDRRLTPGDKLLWMTMRCTMTGPQAPIRPTYDALMQACGLSRSAVARSLKALRLTGWAAANRLESNHYVEGQEYMLYDADHSDALMERDDVQAFVCQCENVKGRIGDLATIIAERYDIPGRKLLLPVASSSNLAPPVITGSSNLELPAKTGSSNLELREKARGSNLELPEHSGGIKLLPPENQGVSTGSNLELPRARSSCSSSNTTTTAGVRAEARAYVWPVDLSELSRRASLNDLGQLDIAAAQMVLDELAAQLPHGRVKNPTVYLRTLIAKAIQGTFEYTDAGHRIAKARGRAAAVVTKAAGVTVVAPLPSVSPATRAAWNAVLQEASVEFGTQIVDLWLKPLALREQADELTLFASNLMILGEVRSKFLGRLQELYFAQHPHRRLGIRLGDGMDQGSVA